MYKALTAVEVKYFDSLCSGQIEVNGLQYLGKKDIWVKTGSVAPKVFQIRPNL